MDEKTYVPSSHESGNQGYLHNYGKRDGKKIKYPVPEAPDQRVPDIEVHMCVPVPAETYIILSQIDNVHKVMAYYILSISRLLN